MRRVKELTELEKVEVTMHKADDLDALKLGIEALKKVKKQRERSDFHGIPPLPGETKED